MCLTSRLRHLCASRHWKEVMRITGVELNTAEDFMKLQHLLDAHLSEHREDIEELCACAVKEEQVRLSSAFLLAGPGLHGGCG